MRRKLRRLAVVTAAAVGLAGVGTVQGGETDRGGWELLVSAKEPGVATGVGFRVLYKNPQDPDGKPPAVTAAEFELPEGMRIDDDALPQCDASDEDFRASGRDACPPETRVGDGTLVAMTGFPGADPVEADVVAFNGDGQLIEVVFFKGTNTVAGMDRLTIEDGKLVAHPPATPGGPPDGRTAVREVRIDVPLRVGEGGRPYVVTPPECTTGRWTSTARYEFADGGSTTVTSESACTRQDVSKPKLRASVEPRRVRAGRRVTLRVRVRSSERECIRGARVRVGNRRARTGRRGRARLKARFAKPGRRWVRVTRPGCRGARTALRVRA